jgi:hypothetical protein
MLCSDGYLGSERGVCSTHTSLVPDCVADYVLWMLWSQGSEEQGQKV